MKFSKTAVKLAAAGALAVAGVVGTAWAQFPTPGGDNVKTAEATMRASYEVVKEWEIEVIPKTVAKEDMLGRDVKASDVGGAATINGNLGLVRVKTNSASWDVNFTTANGGKLALGTKEMGHEPQFDMDCMCVKEKDTGWVYGPKKYLQYANNDSVQLAVGIGMLDNINGTTYILKGVATQATTVAYPAVVVDTIDVIASQTTTATGAPKTGKDVSFAKALTAGSPKGIDGTLGAKLKVGGVAVTAGAARTTGFGPTDTPLTGPAPGNVVIPHDGSEWFFVNVGMAAKDATNTYSIAGNDEGEYEEIFTFTLVADF